MKKIIVCLLCLTLLLSMVSCGSSSSSPFAAELEINSPYSDLPGYAVHLQIAVDRLSYDSRNKIENFMGYSIAAWNEFEADDFCKYIYEQNYLDDLESVYSEFSDIADELTAEFTAPSDSYSSIIDLRSKIYDLVSVNVDYASWNTSYSTNGSSESLKEEFGNIIDSYAKVFYDETILD